MSITLLGMSGADGGIDEMARRTYTREYLLQATALTDAEDENAIMAATGVRLYQAHPTYPRAFVTGIKVSLVESVMQSGGNGALWKATVSYGPIDPQQREMMVESGGSYVFTPLSMKPRPSWSGENEEVPIWKTPAGTPILNSAGDMFDPPVMRNLYRGTLTVNINMASVSIAALYAYSNKVNSDTWNGFDPKTVLVAPISMPERAYDQETDTFYYPMSFNFRIKPEGWTRKIVNAGLRELNGAGTKLLPILVDGVPATSPVPLSATGLHLDPPVSALTFKSYDIEDTLDFTSAFGSDMADLIA